jgi:ATPase subunit of ABC transporter with duplicated ATPase domains
LIGNNGVGKSTLLKIMAGHLHPSAGVVSTNTIPYYVPQHFGQFNDLTVAQALHVDEKLKALKKIIEGNATEANLALLNDDWLLEERCSEALAEWEIESIDLNRKMETLSGGQKTKIFLAGIAIHQPEMVLLDEPSNHMDVSARNILYNYIKTTSNTLIVISHDKTLLNLLGSVYELGRRGITVYGGNYDFYVEQKAILKNALDQDLKSKEKALRKAKEVERESLERKQKLDARGKKKQEKAGLPTISMNTFKNNAEKSTSRIKDAHAEKVETLSQALSEMRKALPDADKIKIDLDNARLHRGKKLITATDINFAYNNRLLWRQPLSFSITSGERIVIKGGNGSGKTTLIKIILGEIQPLSGIIDRAETRSIYIDQDYSLIDNKLTVYEQVQQFNYDKLQEHELKIRLNRFLFTREYWDKPCGTLSGGEKMRLMLCCLMISNQAPDIIILDEPTNNLDIQNTEILTSAISDYKGTLVVVSHDKHFLEQMNVEQEIVLV